MKKNIYFLVIFLLLAGFIFGNIHQNKKIEREKIQFIISDSLKFYSENDLKKSRIDSYLMLRMINEFTGESMPFEEEFFDNDPFVRLLNKEKYPDSLNSLMPELYPPYAVNLKNEYAQSEPFAGVLLKALYCDKLGYNDYDFSVLSTFYNGDGSYWDTHLLLSLIFLKENNCYQTEKIDNLVDIVVKSILKAQERDDLFTDVYAERIAVLYWAGYSEKVKRTWINKLVESYIPEKHGWKAHPSLIDLNSHTTGLTILSLIYYLEDNPKQNFFVR